MRWLCGATLAMIVAHVGLIMRTRTAARRGPRGPYNDPDVAKSIRWVWHDNALAALGAGASRRARITSAGWPRARADGDAAAGSSPAGPAVFLYSCVGTDEAETTPTLHHFVRHYLDLGVPTDRFLLVLHASFETAPAAAAARRAGGGNATRAALAGAAPAAGGGYAAAVRALDGAGLSGHISWFGTFSAQNQGRVRRAIFAALSATGAMRPHDWIVHADSDEFHRYPGGDLRGFLASVAASRGGDARAAAPCLLYTSPSPRD